VTYFPHCARVIMLGIFGSAVLLPQPISSVTVVASSIAGDRLAPEIHLYQAGSHKDFWPTAKTQGAASIPHGYYELEVSSPGYRSFNRNLELGDEHIDVRVVLIPSDEAQSVLALTGQIVNAKDLRGVWVILFPLAGSPSDTTECQVSESGHFRVTAAHGGPYVLTIVRGQKLLRSQAVNMRYRSPELTIDLRE
jgi:hypothetical protein